jgi:hypothetical protein
MIKKLSKISSYKEYRSIVGNIKKEKSFLKKIKVAELKSTKDFNVKLFILEEDVKIVKIRTEKEVLSFLSAGGRELLFSSLEEKMVEAKIIPHTLLHFFRKVCKAH